MLYPTDLPTASISAVFAEEVASCRGKVTDTFDDGERLFTRSVLPHIEIVRPDDRVQGGVALRATAREVWVHPYVFRLVCRNGAIFAQTLQTRHLEDLRVREPEEALRSIREAVEACCAEDVFTQAVQHMRTAGEAQVDLALTLMPLFSRLSATANMQLLSQIMDTFFRDGDQSRFGLVNAITSTARDLGDPESRWSLEEFGGRIATGKIPGPLPNQGRSAMTRRTPAVSVG